MAGDTLPQKRDNDVVSCVFLSHLAANYAPVRTNLPIKIPEPNQALITIHDKKSPPIVMNRCSLQSQDFPTMFHYQSDPGHVNQVKPLSAACLVISRFWIFHIFLRSSQPNSPWFPQDFPRIFHMFPPQKNPQHSGATKPGSPSGGSSWAPQLSKPVSVMSCGSRDSKWCLPSSKPSSSSWVCSCCVLPKGGTEQR